MVALWCYWNDVFIFFSRSNRVTTFSNPYSSSAISDQDPQEATTTQQESDNRQNRAGSTADSATEATQDQDDDSGSVLPLWAQRQLSIRRQSAIPRLELDFVSGSGILPPASRELKTVGGAKILSYPVLISDMVHVVLDDIQAKGGVLDGSDVTEESEEDSPDQQQQNQQAVVSGGRGGKTGGRGGKTASLKRKKAGSGQKGRGAKSTLVHNRPSLDDDGQSGDEAQEDLEDRPRSGHMTGIYKRRRQSVSTGHREQERQWHQLAPPVELGSVRRTGIVEEEDYAMDIEYEGGAASDVNDEDYHDDGAESAVQQRHIGASSSHKANGRLYSVPEHLRIPPQEVDLAMQLSREMMETKKRKKAQKDKDGKKKRRAVDADEQEDDDGHRAKGKGKGKQAVRNNDPSGHIDADAGLRRASLKTLKPLLDATLAVEQGRKHFNAWDKNFDGEDMAQADHITYYHESGLTNQYYLGMAMADTMTTSTMDPSGVSGSGVGKKSSKANSSNSGHSASHSTGSATGSGSNGGGPSSATSSASPKKAAKVRESKATTKKCEACGASETPCWRPGYTAHSALCNSCGLRYKKSNVFCAKVGCKYIPLKTEYAAMEAERVKSGRAHLVCHKCKGPVALPIIKE